MSTIWRIIGAILYVLSAVGVFAVGVSITDREPPIKYEGARAMSPMGFPGGVVEVEFTVFRSRICQSITQRWLVDSSGTRHSIPSFTIGLSMLAGRETYQRTIQIPVGATLGPAEYYVHLKYQCNLLHRVLSWNIEVESPHIRFEVIPNKDAPPITPPSVGIDG